MKKKMLLIVIIFLSFFVSIEKSFAISLSSTTPFGGRVISTVYPGVTCTGTGTLFILTGMSGTSTNFYATNPMKKPRMGGWILGKADILPDLSICTIKLGTLSSPFPVKKTSIYGVSK